MNSTGSKDDLYEISDFTDWLNTPLGSLAPVDAALRCHVCKDFYKTPMITSCSHTFCSLCIRRCLANDGKCPTCRTSEQENKLRRNGVVESLVEDFLRARPILLGHARTNLMVIEPHSPKRNLKDVDPESTSATQPHKKTRSSSRFSSRPREESHDVVLEREMDEDDYQPDDGLATCPVCRTRMKLETIDPHLNKCLNEDSSKKPPTSISASSLSSLQPGPNSFQKTSNKLDRLPQLNYSLFRETALRKKLLELGISGQGSRQLLERRHAEWVTLWNANCDATRPRRKADLLFELDVWERTQGGRASSLNSSLSTGSQLLNKDFDGASWAAKHDQSFQKLIANARQKLGRKDTTEKPAEPMEGEKYIIGRTESMEPGTDKIEFTMMATSADRQSPDILADEVVHGKEEEPTILRTPVDNRKPGTNDDQIYAPSKPAQQRSTRRRIFEDEGAAVTGP